MDDILLYLALKFDCNWMEIYDSLQRRDDLKAEDVIAATKTVDAKYTTLIALDYPDNLKKIYKPPFGLFSYGCYDLLTNNCISIYADTKDADQLVRLNQLRKLGFHLMWNELTVPQITRVLSFIKTGNVFCFDQLIADNDEGIKSLTSNKEIIGENIFVSENWKKGASRDYSLQSPQRVYLGLSGNVVLFTKPTNKEMEKIASYCSLENIPVYIDQSIFDSNIEEHLARTNFKLFNNLEELSQMIKK